ncbi:NAD(+) diphosphatase [Nocardioides sp. SYSU DS0663]|uniref:NAD(+) diphosphatase n=1 Tax=Nocardioides sp. SYSU DS0663 TaxID=3416445 RepID=UPI003F4C6F1F
MTFVHERLTVEPHDRAGALRKDDAWLAEQWADPETRVLVVSGTRVRVEGGRVPWVPPADAPEGARVLLGQRGGRTWFAVIVGSALARGEEGWLPLRGLLPVLDDDPADAPMLLHAVGVAEWHAATRHCPRCGGSLDPRAAGHELVCVDCGRSQFPRMDPAVIMLVTAGEPGSDDERCLLGRQSVWPEGRYSTLAGFCEPGETLEDAVRREVAEETGVAVGAVEYFGNQPWPFPASLMLGFVGRATTTAITVDEDEIEDARWFTRAGLRAQAESGEVVLPGGVSISRSLIEHWYGGSLPGRW